MDDLYGWWLPSQLPEGLKNTTIANPCGNIAKFMFTDEFTQIIAEDQEIGIDDSDVIDGGHEWRKFKLNGEVSETGGYWTNPVDPHLIAWY